ncbi:metallophosphoesterase [Cohnella nanjingensis]|uniref:Metallophosphoesterase n=1 Tax=Cohnella nanjingensis TaxID=1387779 RepID=A0A7X0VD22_9BACL|nr:metallophosphoesterase [Cohnella nanjingensis]MBB6669236.1 metallophosphoesterase [Cohnella nanjingensis]
MRTLTPRMIATFSLFLIAFAGLNLYAGWNLSLPLREWWPGFPPGLYWPLFYLVAFAYIIGRAPIRPRALGRALKVLGAHYIGLFEYLILTLPFADLAGWLLIRAGIDRGAVVSGVAVAAAALLLALFFVGSRNAWRPVVREYDLHVAKHAGGLRRLDVLIASDLHLGNIVGNRHLDRLLALAEVRKPDLILLAGDVIDDAIEPFVRNRMSERLQRLRAKYGTYAVLGNHEYYGGHVEEYVARMKEIGIPVLQDEGVTIADAFHVVGRKDRTAESADPQGRRPIGELLSAFNPKLPTIVMDHQPHQYAAAAEAGVDVLVSGHTHRGQFAPNHLLTRRLFELDWGYLRKGKMHALVSSGFGTWGPPVRLASRSEIIHLVLRFD